ncbi:hypothetical protein DRW07_14655 [Alteromonas sediminis]|uniref:HTH araC/xylS-type domain-containing protein n=1 Tax=Alteromonas sediminis TaxID=2259342 RepID=A0A3N5XZ78_9ALTE|nr:hypothetical protein [Alteromonas sediminis]RPJ66040.1 hypothetical protein DRW07_14655 [Alteromonas sediminis]
MILTSAYFIILLLLVFWLYIIYVGWQHTDKQQGSEQLYAAIALWPMGLVDSIIRVLSIEAWFPVAGVFHFIPVAVAGALLHHLHNKTQPKYRRAGWITALLVIASIGAQVPLLLHPVNAENWISTDLAGAPIQLWWIYLPYLVTLCCLLILSGQMLDIGRRYHKYLPWQSVDIHRYKISVIMLLAGCLLAVSLTGLLILVVIGAGGVAIEGWTLGIDLFCNMLLLFLLWSTVVAVHVLPSPIEYNRVFSASMKATERDTETLNRADKVMISGKCYKSIGLTITEFARKAGVEPTDLLIALKRIKKHDFRGYIFHYRMEYARNVVMNTDTSIANVAKRLGFNSEKFLSGAFLHYLEKRK